MIETGDYSIKVEEGVMIFESKRLSPVLVSIPHDGLPFREFSGLFEPRKIGHRGRDLHVWPIAKDILSSATVNAVRGLMPRTLIDYNRAWPCGINYYPLTQKEVHTALDDPRLYPAYFYYHASIDRILWTSIKKFGRNRCLLIDLHGFGKQPSSAPQGGYDLILGTGNRISIPHGDIDNRLAYFMTCRGYSVFLPKTTSVGLDGDPYSAEFTTRHHSEKHSINVIQVEIASRFRVQGVRELGQKLSADFAEFIRSNYLEC